jgi:CO/xanthine dehydrogenase FAD-binding subunit
MRKATPKTGEEAAQLLAESRGAWIVSGGTTVMSNLLMSVLRPPKMLVSIERIEEAGRFDSESGWIGAGVRFAALHEAEGWPALVRTGVEQHRPRTKTPTMHRVTIGGRLMSDGGASALATAMMALGAEAELVSPAGRRRAPLETILANPTRNKLEQYELLLGLWLAPLREESGRRVGEAYVEELSGGGQVKESIAVMLSRAGDQISAAQVALGGLDPVVGRARQVESALIGRKGNAALFSIAGQTAREEVDPEDKEERPRDQRLANFERITGEAVAAAFTDAGA